MNKNRHTASVLNKQISPTFVLNIPIKGMENLVLSIGAVHGTTISKITQFNIKLCKPGWDNIAIPTQIKQQITPYKKYKKPKNISSKIIIEETQQNHKYKRF